MTVRLARALTLDRKLPRAEVLTALFESLRTGRPLLQVVMSHSEEAAECVERVVAASRQPRFPAPRVAVSIAERLPRGLCEQLLAIPIDDQGPSGAISVAAADPDDPHIPQEFGYHLGTSVRLYRAALVEILLALDDWREERASFAYGGRATPALGTPVVKLAPKPPRKPASQPPIPLVRRARFEPTARPLDFEQRCDEALSALDAAESPTAVVHALADGAIAAGRRALVLVPKGDRFVAQASRGLARDPKTLWVPRRLPEHLEAKLAESFFLGQLPEFGAVSEALGPDEVWVGAVHIAERRALLLMVGQLRPESHGAKMADRLVSQAAHSLKRLIVARRN